MADEREVTIRFFQQQVDAAVEEWYAASIEAFMWKERAKLAKKRAQRLEAGLTEVGGDPDDRVRRTFAGVPEDIRYWECRGGEPPTKYDWREATYLCGADFNGDRGGFGSLKCARTLGHKGEHYADRSACEKRWGTDKRGYGGQNCTIQRGHSGSCGDGVLREAEHVLRRAQRK